MQPAQASAPEFDVPEAEVGWVVVAGLLTEVAPPAQPAAKAATARQPKRTLKRRTLQVSATGMRARCANDYAAVKKRARLERR